MSIDPLKIIKGPVLSEESQIQITKANQYTFRVVPSATKAQIRDAVEAMFPGRRVVKVNTMNYEGKKRRQFGTMRQGVRPSWKKAIVTLRKGDTIEFV
jgi:large subunit ribosomal protein L23